MSVARMTVDEIIAAINANPSPTRALSTVLYELMDRTQLERLSWALGMPRQRPTTKALATGIAQTLFLTAGGCMDHPDEESCWVRDEPPTDGCCEHGHPFEAAE